MTTAAQTLRDIWQGDTPAARSISQNGAAQVNRCVDCHARAPATNTNFTLISAEHGWRLSFSRDLDGRRVSEWRCPHCWKAYKARQKG